MVEPIAHLTPHDGEHLRNLTLYCQLVYNLVDLNVTRLDISYVVYHVSQFMIAPNSTYLIFFSIQMGLFFHSLYFSSQSHFFFELTLMWIKQKTLHIIVPLLVIASYLVILLSFSVVRNKLSLLDLALRWNIMLFLTPPLNSFNLIVSYYRIWVCVSLLLLLYYDNMSAIKLKIMTFCYKQTKHIKIYCHLFK